MSGLAALFHRTGHPLDPDAIERMLDVIAYLGPDGRGARRWDGAALGCLTLAVTPEDAAQQQPLRGAASGIAIVADARLDNRAEITGALGIDPAQAGTLGDAALILRAYEAWGLSAPERLLGDFVFVIWDPRERRMVCARDTSGQRTLYYRLDRHTFAAASQIHPLLLDPSVPMAPDEARIQQFLTPLHVFRNDQEAPHTFFEGISILPAGHLLVVEPESHRLSRYWDLAPPREIRYRRDQDYVQHFGDLFVEAVRARMRTARPIGALLSGGLDSASVVSVARTLQRLDSAPDHGFAALTMAYDDDACRDGCDESAFVRDVETRHDFVARRVAVDHWVANFAARPDGFMPMPAKPVGELDVLLSEASRSGAAAVLTGHMGDNCFGWSQRFFDSLLRRGRLAALVRHLQAYRRTSRERLRKTLALHCALPLAPLVVQRPLRAALLRRDAPRHAALVPDWMTPDARAALQAHDLRLRLEEEAARRFPGTEQERIFRSLYPAEVLPISGAYPVQVARPFADRRLHEFLLAIPPEQLFEPHPYAGQFYAGSKLILRRAMLEILPESVRTRTRKTQFSSLVTHELDARWPEYAAAFGGGAVPEVVRRGWVDRDAFFARLARLRQGDFRSDGIFVTRVLHLETWLRTFALPRHRATTVRPHIFDSHDAIGRSDRPARDGSRRAAAPDWLMPSRKEVIAT